MPAYLYEERPRVYKVKDRRNIDMLSHMFSVEMEKGYKCFSLLKINSQKGLLKISMKPLQKKGGTLIIITWRMFCYCNHTAIN